MESNIEMSKVVAPHLPDVVPDSESAVQVKATLGVMYTTQKNHGAYHSV